MKLLLEVTLLEISITFFEPLFSQNKQIVFEVLQSKFRTRNEFFHHENGLLEIFQNWRIVE